MTTEPPFDDFESHEDALAEDRLRVEHLRLVKAALTTRAQSSSGWVRNISNMRAAIDTAGIEFDIGEINELINWLELGVYAEDPTPTLASSLTMRMLREKVFASITPLIEATGGAANWRAFTVVKSTWACTASELDKMSGERLLHQFRTDLNRAGVSAVDGQLIAFVHGEFDAATGLYTPHIHGVCSATKAASLSELKRLAGYTKTSSGATPVLRSQLKGGPRQLAYGLKAFWPHRPTVEIDGVAKRTREGQRIPEPYHVQQVLWMHRQPLASMVLVNGVWSPRLGGTPEGRKLYLLIRRLSAEFASERLQLLDLPRL